jgi:hypothetical protein
MGKPSATHPYAAPDSNQRNLILRSLNPRNDRKEVKVFCFFSSEKKAFLPSLPNVQEEAP